MSFIVPDRPKQPFRPKALIRRGLHARRLRTPIYLMSHHKAGTVLVRNVFARVAQHLNLSFSRAYGYFDAVDDDSDIVLFEHSLLGPQALAGNYIGIHLRRDPRDVVASAYLYHQTTREDWCLAVPAHDGAGPIRHPLVPWFREHFPEDWKRAYLARLNGRSYQAILRDLDQEDGLLWEMENCSHWTISDMLAWGDGNDRTLEVTFEALMRDFDGTFRRMFRHAGFSDRLTEDLVQLAQAENLSRMSDADIARNPHISGRDTAKWERFFTPRVQARFDALFPDAVARLGYADQRTAETIR